MKVLETGIESRYFDRRKDKTQIKKNWRYVASKNYK